MRSGTLRCLRRLPVPSLLSPAGHRLSVRQQASAAAASASAVSAVAKASKPTFKTVPFVKEDMELVMEEVPDFKYYFIGDEDPVQNIYANTPLDKSILKNGEYHAPDLSELKKPELEYSTLENGLKIVSIDRDGLTCSLGLFVHAGSRYEDVTNYGVSHMIELMAYHSTAHLSYLRTIKTIEALGANATCQAGREHVVYQAECLRHYMPLLVPMLIGNVLFPRLLNWEVKDRHRFVDKQRRQLEKKPDAFLTEMLHITAYHNNTLGNKLYATERSLSYFNEHTVRDFMMQHFSPNRMVFMGVNVKHEELCKWLMRSFVDYNPIPHQDRPEIKPIYTGGDQRIEANLPVCHTAIGFEVGGWNSRDLEAATVLQTLLGGGGSFSTGGPGKGIHTRLYTDVLNRHNWLESCVAFNTMYSDSGLFGLYFVHAPLQGTEAIAVMCDQLVKMKTVTAEELKRAKNCLKASIWMNLENRAIVMEDVARQLLMSGKVVDGHAFCAAIDAVTEKDIARVATEMLQKRPTVVCYGDIATIPHYEEICTALKTAAK